MHLPRPRSAANCSLRANSRRTGLRPGEKSSEYQRLSIRLPDDTLAALDAIGRVVKPPAWRVIVDALAAYQGDAVVLSEVDRRLVRGLLRRSQ